jgi:hypothetical protein
MVCMNVYIVFVNIKLIHLLQRLSNQNHVTGNVSCRKCVSQTKIILELNTSPTNNKLQKYITWVYWTGFL